MGQGQAVDVTLTPIPTISSEDFLFFLFCCVLHVILPVVSSLVGFCPVAPISSRTVPRWVYHARQKDRRRCHPHGQAHHLDGDKNSGRAKGAVCASTYPLLLEVGPFSLPHVLSVG